MPTTRSITTLLPNEVLPLLERLRFLCSRRFTSQRAGENLKGKGGNSTEFADYRDYSDGDDLRYIDWNILARLRRPYLKVFHREEESHLVLLVDASISMRFQQKLEQALRLAAVFGTCGMFQQERVTVYLGGQSQGAPPGFGPVTGRAGLGGFYRFLESVTPLGSGSLDEALHSTAAFHRGRGVILILSDFLTYEDLGPCFNRLLYSGLTPYGIQILAPEERHPDLEQDLRLVDSETGAGLDITNQGNLMDLYQETRLALEQELACAFRQRGGSFLSVDSHDKLRDLVTGVLRREAWLG